jgi:tetratricopeptide (TPR) repeat protein
LDSFTAADEMYQKGGALRRQVTQKDHARLLYNKAKSAFNCKRYLQAVADLDRCLEIIEDYVNAIELRAECYFELFDYDKAISDHSSLVNPSDKLTKLAKLAKKHRKNNHYKVSGRVGCCLLFAVRNISQLTVVDGLDACTDRCAYDSYVQRMSSRVVL